MTSTLSDPSKAVSSVLRPTRSLLREPKTMAPVVTSEIKV